MKNLLNEAREKINRIDREMAALFAERMQASEMVAEHKKIHGLQVEDPVRESEVLARNSQMIENSLYREYYMNFQKKVMEISKAYQSRLIGGMKIAFSGTEGAYAHIAACKLFPSAIKIGYDSFEQAYSAVVNGDCDIAILPVENSYNGEVGQVTELMFSGPLYVNALTELPISHDLLAPKGTRIEDITTVISHPQALAQCQGFITENSYKQIEYQNTALAAKYVAEKNDNHIAAIASAEASEIFDLEVLATNINASRSNTTKFAVFSRSENEHKSSEMGLESIILFTVRNEAGSLAEAINIIGKYGFNMSSLRSRPMKELLWEYYFYMETEGNLKTEAGQAMIKELEKYCDRLKIVGSFRKT